MTRGPVTRRPLRLIVADDSFLAREAIVAVLRRVSSFDVRGSVSDLEALMNAVEAEAPDVVVTDAALPPDFTDEGIRAAAGLRATHPQTGVVILTSDVEPAWVVDLFRDGTETRAYLLKDRVRTSEGIVNAVHAVADGGSVVDPEVVELLIATRARPKDSPLADLSPRERQILAEIATGKANAAIAHELHLSKRSVEKHIHAIFRKLDLGETDAVSPRVKAALMFVADPTYAVSNPVPK